MEVHFSRFRSLLMCMVLLTVLIGEAQQFCEVTGNLVIYSNYEGGVLDIEIDENVADLKIGVMSYESTSINITGAFAANVTGLVYAGFDSPGGNCGNPAATNVNGIDPGLVQIYGTQTVQSQAPFLGDEIVPGIPLVNCMTSGSVCASTDDQGGNSSPQVVQYFLAEFGATAVLRSYWTDYDCFPATGFAISDGGNCCISDPVTPPNPLYVTGGGYEFPIDDEFTLCDGDVVLDMSFYSVLVQPPIYTGYVWSDGQEGEVATFNTPGAYSFSVSDYCNSAADPLTASFEILPCGAELDLQASEEEICLGEEVVLTLEVIDATPPLSFLWTPDIGDGQGPFTVAPLVTTTYEVTVTDGLGQDVTAQLTVQVDDSAPILDLGEDVSICTDDVILDATTPSATAYLWSDGSNGPTLSTNEIGVYSVTVSGECFSVMDEIEVLPAQEVEVQLPDDAIICPEQSIVLDASHPNAVGYVWNTGSEEASIEADTPGLYSVQVIGACGTAEDEFELIAIQPLSDPFEDVYELCDGQQLRLDATASGATSFLWEDGVEDPSNVFEQAGEVLVSVSNTCETLQLRTAIETRICDCAVYIPNAFSPDGDLVNDRLQVRYSPDCSFVNFSFSVYDRWGQLVFQTNNPDDFWNGTSEFREFFAPDGLYAFHLEANVASPRGGTESLDQIGSLLLIR